MSTDELLTLLACAVLLLAPGFYLLEVRRGRITPNPGTWFVWALVGSINGVSYYLSVGSTITGVFGLVSAVVLTTVFVYSLLNGKFEPLGWLEWGTIIFGLVLSSIWYMTYSQEGSTDLTQGWIQLPLLLGFWPTIEGIKKGLRDGKIVEQPLPWTFGCLAYVFQIALVHRDPNSWWLHYIFPVVNGLLANATVGILAYRANKKILNL